MVRNGDGDIALAVAERSDSLEIIRMLKVRKTPCRPRSWANSSLL